MTKMLDEVRTVGELMDFLSQYPRNKKIVGYNGSDTTVVLSVFESESEDDDKDALIFSASH